MHTYIHTYIRAYIHTYTHTYIHTYICRVFVISDSFLYINTFIYIHVFALIIYIRYLGIYIVGPVLSELRSGSLTIAYMRKFIMYMY